MISLRAFKTSKRNTYGFTLIELLVAMTIMGMVMIIIFSGFHLGVTSWQKGEKRIDRQQRLRVILDQFEQDIRSAFFLKVKCNPDGINEQKAIAVRAESDKVTLVTVTQGLSGEQTKGKSPLRMVSYYVNGEGDENSGLVMEEFNNYIYFFEDDDGDSEVYQLDPDVTDISFKYYRLYKDPEKAAKLNGLDELEKEEQPKGEWVTDWNPCDELKEDTDTDDIEKPKYSEWIGAIEVTLTISPEEEDESDIELTRIIPLFAGMDMVLDKNI